MSNMPDSFRGISGSFIEFLGKTVCKRPKPGGEEKLFRQAHHMRQLSEALGEYCLNPIAINEDSYTMEYYPGISLDVYCTVCSQQVAFYRVHEMIDILWKRMYSKHKEIYDVHEYILYLQKRLQYYAELGEDTSELAGVLEKLLDNLNGKTVIERCKAGLVHGDLTFENVLLTADSFVIIDSNPPPGDFAPWTLDVGKLRQSLFSLYEMTKYSGVKSRAGLESIYTHLSTRFDRLMPRWDEAIEIQSRFFEASHYIRLLDYKCKIDPQMARQYYKRAIDVLTGVVESLCLMKM